jgi:DNA relaxase NicK
VTVRTVDLSEVTSQVINLLCVPSLPGLTRRNYQNWREVCEQRPQGARGYQEVWVLPLGVTVYAKPLQVEHGPHVHVEVKGQACQAAGLLALARYFRCLEGMFPGYWRATRLDLAWDGVPFTPGQAFEAAKAGHVRTWAKRESLGWHDKPLSPDEGSTCELGSRPSERFLRVYDKRGPTRCELELKGERAAAVAAQLAGLPAREWAPVALGHLRDFVDFVDRESDANLSRAAPLPWWSAFVGRAAKAGLRLVHEVVPTLERSRDWFRRQVGPTLAVLLAADRGSLEGLLGAVDEGRRRWGPRHRLLLAAAGLAATG